MPRRSAQFDHQDWLGTKRAEASAGGCFTAFTSMPVGNGLSTLASAMPCLDATEHHFTGKERDSESGNDYFGARYYASTMGRWLSPDWSAKEDPVPYANLGDPQSLNLYSYVRNNPLSRVDADGHVAGVDDAAEAIIVVGVLGAVALEAGAQYYNHTPEGQRSLNGAVNAAKENFTSNVSAVKNKISSWFSKKTTPLPKGLVGTEPKPTKGRTNSGPLSPDHGGSGDAGKDFGTLTGGNSGPAPKGSTYPPGTQVGENGTALRPATGNSGPRIDIPANGDKPHETLHYPPPPPPAQDKRIP